MHRYLLLLVVASFFMLSNSSWAYQTEDFYPVENIQPGMTGTLLCGLGEGGAIETYTVVVKSVLGNRGRNGDGWRAVLIEAGDDLIEAHGGFVNGMGGAPVYFDGRLAGAFYIHYEWTLQNFGLMRPIDRMLKLWEDEEVIAGDIENLPMFTPPDVFIDETRETIHDFGPSEFQPGSMICTIETIGDVNAWEVGCITYIDPDTGRFLAFGHDAYGSLGDVNIPVADCYVYHTFESIEQSFVLGIPTRIIGTMTTDAWQGISGTLSEIPNLLKVELFMYDEDYERELTSMFHAADDPRIYPDSVPDAIKRALERGLDTAGRGYVTVHWTLHTTAWDVFEFEQVYLADDYAAAAGSDLKKILAALAKNDFTGSVPKLLTGSINLTKAEKAIVLRDERHVVEGEDTEGLPEKVKPGEEIEIKLRMEPWMAGGFDRSFTFQVPPEFPEGEAKIQIYGGLKSLPSNGQVPANIFDEMKKSRDGLVDPLEVEVPVDLYALMESFAPEYRADELVIQIVSTEDDDPDGDREHFEIVERLDGIVTGVIARELKVNGGDE